MQQLDGTSGLLWTYGTAQGMGLSGQPYNPSVKSLPRPIAFARYSGEGALQAVAYDILALTKLDWNNDNPFNPFPVTLSYAKTLAQVVSNVPTLQDNAYRYRLFL